MKELNCKNCKHGKSYSGWAEIWATYAEIITGISFGCRKKAKEFKTEYGCPYYQRKWWKIGQVEG